MNLKRRTGSGASDNLSLMPVAAATASWMGHSAIYYGFEMAFPIKICAICSEEFELKPDKPGFANRCPQCSTPEAMDSSGTPGLSPEERQAESELNEVRRRTIRDMLYRKDS
jgi:hypothetical protein